MALVAARGFLWVLKGEARDPEVIASQRRVMEKEHQLAREALGIMVRG